MAKTIEKYDPNNPPDLAQHYREEIEAILENPATVIEHRFMPAASNGTQDRWGGSETGVNAIREMLDRSNWKEGYEFRVRPDGIHGYITYDADNPRFDYLSVYSRPRGPDITELCLHFELDPEDPSRVRAFEVIKPTPEEQA